MVIALKHRNCALALTIALMSLACGPAADDVRRTPGTVATPNVGATLEHAAEAGLPTSLEFDRTPAWDAATVEEHERVLDAAIRERKAEIFERYLDAPFPSPDADDLSTRCWGRAGFALAAFRSGVHLEVADRYLRTIDRELGFAREGKADASPCYFALPLLLRIYFDPQTQPHLTDEVRQLLLDAMHRYVDLRSHVAVARASTWRIEMSENHDAIQKATFLLATRALMEAPAPYGPTLVLADGLDVATHHHAWVDFWMRYFAERAREGIGCEIASPIYAKHSLASYLGVRDFSGDPGLAARADDFLLLYWADVAQDFLPSVGVRGGAETRTYKNAYLKLGTRQATRPAAYLYGWHDAPPPGVHPLTLVMAASDFAPPALVHAQATRKADDYLYRARRCGRGTVARVDDEPHYRMQFDDGRGSHLLRTSFVTDEYVIGALTFDPDQPYNALAGQNRTMGVSFASGVDDRIVVHGIGRDKDGTVGYDEITGVVAPDVLVVARDPNQRRSAGLRIFVADGTLWDARLKREGWWFSRTDNAYVAIRMSDAGHRVVAEAHGFMLEPRDSWSPVVIQLGRPDRDGDFASFRARVLKDRYRHTREARRVTKRSLSTDDYDRVASRIRYRSLAGSLLEVWSHNRQRPRIDGREVDLLPPLTYDSPFLASRYRSDRVTLFHPDFGRRELDFSQP